MKNDAKEQSLSPVQKRLTETHFDILREPPSKSEIMFLNTVLCQTSLPVSKRGLSKVDVWERTNGRAVLKIKPGEIAMPTGEITKTEIPYGRFARLFFYHLCTRIVKEGARDIELGSSFQQFAKSIGIDTSGRELGNLKRQVYNILGCEFLIHNFSETETARIAQTSFMRIADDIKLWLPKTINQLEIDLDDATNIRISERFFETTRQHAIPFDPRAIAALTHNCMAMDVLNWLTQLLPRLDHDKWKPISWGFLYNMYGHSYDRLRDFRRYFLDALHQAITVYPAASRGVELSNELDEYGAQKILLRYAPPMVAHTTVYIPQATAEHKHRQKAEANKKAQEHKDWQRRTKAVQEGADLLRAKKAAIKKLRDEASTTNSQTE